MKTITLELDKAIQIIRDLTKDGQNTKDKVRQTLIEEIAAQSCLFDLGERKCPIKDFENVCNECEECWEKYIRTQ